MALKADMHMHSDNSVDGQETVDGMCRAAVEKGFDTICFTEHFDLNPEDEGFSFLNFEKYSIDIERAREKHGTHLRVLKGIEFSEPHLYRREFEDMLGRDFDFVLASVHYVKDYGVYFNRRFPEVPLQKTYEDYYQSILETVEMGGFDALAHIDLPKRYLPERYEPAGIIEAILQKLVGKNIALEFNRKGLYYPIAELHPSPSICELYRKHGGSKVTVGSDAHKGEEIGQDFDRIMQVVQEYNFQPVCCIGRKQTPLAWN